MYREKPHRISYFISSFLHIPHKLVATNKNENIPSRLINYHYSHAHFASTLHTARHTFFRCWFCIKCVTQYSFHFIRSEKNDKHTHAYDKYIFYCTLFIKEKWQIGKNAETKCPCQYEIYRSKNSFLSHIHDVLLVFTN